MAILNIPDKAGATRETLSKILRLLRNRGKEAEQNYAGYKFRGKEVYRKVIDTGALPNSTSKSVAHGVAAMDSIVKLRGTAYNLDGSSEVQDAQPMGDAAFCKLNANATNVVLLTTADQTAFDGSSVVIEYTLA